MPSYRYKGRREHSGHHLGEQEASENRGRVRQVIHEVRSHHSGNTEGGNTRGHVTQCTEHEVCEGGDTRGHVTQCTEHKVCKAVIHAIMSHNEPNTRCVKR